MTTSQDQFERWVEAMRLSLEELGAQEFDYPLGVNIVRPPSAAPPDVPGVLKGLYAACDGISMPDVHVGYFVDPSSRVVSARERGEPVRIEGPSRADICVFGSDGGGGRFAISSDGTVYYLPSSGGVVEGAYVEDMQVKARRVAPSLVDFLWLLRSDLEAFVRGDEGHAYLAS